MNSRTARAGRLLPTSFPGALACLLIGVALIQAAWIIAVPAFRGIDEWDHAYRAAAVAHGEWRADPTAATRGTGAMVRAPDDIVAAAQPECERLPYTEPEDCEGTPNGDGTTSIASGAGRYNPLFYALVGYPSRLFEGVGALYVMRTVAAGLCLLFLAMAVGCMRTWRGSPVAPVATVAALTPMVFFTTTLAAPNGVEMMAGLAWCCSLLALSKRGVGRPDAGLLVVAAASGATLVTLRSLGPMWLVLILGTVLLWAPERPQPLLRLHRYRGGLALYAALAVSGLASVAWTVSQSSLNVGTVLETKNVSLGETLLKSGEIIPLWFLQGIGAFPYRDQLAPLPVYILFVLLGLLAVEGAVRHAKPRDVRVLLLLMVGWFVVPFVITAITWEKYNHTWQGRYGLAWGLALAVLIGLAWEQKFREWWPSLAVGAGAVWIAAQVPGVVHVLNDEARHSPLVAAGSWSPPPVALVGLLVVAGSAGAWIGGLAAGRTLVAEPARLEPDRQEATISR